MKQRGLLYGVLAAAALAASCSNNTEPTGGGQLADGKYPLTFTASVGEMRTRAGGKDTWTGTEKIGVRLGDGAAARYVIGTDMQATPDGDDQTVYWQNAGPATVAAWYPCEAVTADLTDQTGGYETIDFLRAETAEAVYNRPLSLDFKHRMAKVKCVVKKGPGISDSDVEAAQLTLFGWTQATVEEGIPTGTGNAGGAIKPTADGEALLVAQNMDGRDFIKVTAGGRDFCYTPQNGDGSLEAGKAYTYTITLKADGIEVTTATGGQWTPGGEETVTSKEVIKKYTAEELKPGDYFYITNGGDWAVSDGGLRKVYADGTVEWAETNPTPDATKGACIGVVCSTDPERIGADATIALAAKGVMTPHGLVMALTNASEGCYWGESGKDEPGIENMEQLKKMYENVNGYRETQWIIDTYGSDETLLRDTYSTFYHASRYGTAASGTARYAAPANTSGWFVPAIGQWWDILTNLGGIDLSDYEMSRERCMSINGAAPTVIENLNKHFGKIEGATLFKTNVDYQSSSELYYKSDTPPINICAVVFDVFNDLRFDLGVRDSKSMRVRCCLAF